MKKITILILTIVLSFVSFVVFAEYEISDPLVQQCEYCRVSYPVFINGIETKEISQLCAIEKNGNGLSGTLHISLNDICELLKVDYELDMSSFTAKIITYTPKSFSNDFEITKETAVKLANIYLEELFGSKYNNKAKIYEIDETTDDYYVSYTELENKAWAIYISKKDGRLLGVRTDEFLFYSPKTKICVSDKTSVFPIATKAYAPLEINNIRFQKRFFSIFPNIEMHIPLELLSHIFNVDVAFNEEKARIDIYTGKSIDYTKDYQICKEAAIRLSDAYFEQKFGNDFIRKNNLNSVEETKDEYIITRRTAKKSGYRKNSVIRISKKDGRLININV